MGDEGMAARLEAVERLLGELLRELNEAGPRNRALVSRAWSHARGNASSDAAKRAVDGLTGTDTATARQTPAEGTPQG